MGNLLGNLFGGDTPSPPPIPEPPPATPMADDAKVLEAKRKSRQRLQAQRGRASTLLSEAEASDKLGG